MCLIYLAVLPQVKREKMFSALYTKLSNFIFKESRKMERLFQNPSPASKSLKSLHNKSLQPTAEGYCCAPPVM
jgi:hypothetical protein